MGTKKTFPITSVFILVILGAMLSFLIFRYVSLLKIDGPVVTVYFIDVGQGDAALICADGINVLIDGGEESAYHTVARYVEEYAAGKIDWLVATHPHSDHIGSLGKIIENFDVTHIIAPKVVHTTNTYERFLRAASDKNLKITTPTPGYAFGSGDVSFTVVAPCSDNYSDLNNYSVTLKMEYKRARFLFTGDIEYLAEAEILASGRDISADVLKVAHHGSDTSSSDGFLSAVSPIIAVISCGAGNMYGHPHEKTLTALENAGAVIYRTDMSGTLTFTTDGDKIVYSGQN